MQRLKKILFISVLAAAINCLHYTIANAQYRQREYVISYKLLNIEEGLAARESFCGLQDGKGFVWFGTRNGLNRYDGKKFQLFTRRNFKMQENNIVQMASDMGNQLFILYGYPGYSRLAIGKVDVLNQQSLQIQTLTETFKNLPFKESNVYWITNDGTDRVNIMTYNPYQLWQYTAKEGFKLRFEMKDWSTDTYKYSVPTGPLNYFYKDVALIGFGGHIKQYILNGSSSLQIETLPEASFNVVSFKNASDFVIQQINHETETGFFNTVNTKGEFVVNPPEVIDQLKEVNHAQSLVIPINNDTSCILKVAAKGIFLYNNKSFIKLIDAGEISDFNNLHIYESFTDKLGNIWVCTSVGVFEIKVKKNRFTHFFTKEQNVNASNNQTRGIWVDKTGVVYANLWNNLFIQNKEQQQSVSTNFVKYALLNHAGKLYTSSYNLEQYDGNHKKLINCPNANTGRDILSCFSLNDSIILMGKMELIFKYNVNTQKLDSIKSYNKRINLPYRFLKRKDGTVWVAGENGLLLLNKNGDLLDFFNSTSASKIKLPSENLTDVFEDKYENVWFTTNGDGLYKWNRKKNTFKKYALEEGFPTNILYRIEEDAKHNLWISSENGLVFFNPQNEITNTFFVKDGLSHNEFNRMSSFKADDGRLFFGGMNGINAFNPNDLLNDTVAIETPLQIISFQQYSVEQGKLIDLTPEILHHNKIVLNSGDKFFNIEFRLLDYENKITRYAYKIEGQDKDWNYTTESSIRISGLPYGNYQLQIKGQTVSGQWSRSQLIIPIEVKSPVYKKWWFQLILIGILTIGIFLFFNYRTSKLEQDKLQLETIVASRTTQLQKTLGERELLLKEIHHRVKNNLQIISGLLDLQKEEIEAEESKAVFNEGQSRVKSIALIHQNLYQNDNLANIKFSSFVKDMAVQVGEVFEQLNSKMKVTINMPDLFLDIDTAVPMGLIVNELLTNAFKYASSKTKEGLIKIDLTEKEKGTYILTFADDGPGIQHNVDFTTAYTLGLRLIRGLAAQLYGEATYNYNNGSVFTITFKDSATRKMEE